MSCDSVSKTRRKFVCSGTVVAYALLLPGCFKKTSRQKEEVGSDNSNSNSTNSSTNNGASNPGVLQSCDITTDDIEGPYYRIGAPVRSNIKPNGASGDDVDIKGIVYSDDCASVLANATVEIWQADSSGAYDSNSAGYDYRGKQVTDASGSYSFSSIIPGKYLNGSKYRPAHVHVKITAEGHEELITQIYFKGDVEIAEDPWASKDDAQMRILSVSNSQQVQFNIALAKG